MLTRYHLERWCRNIFGKDAFFQPYLPLQQIDMCRAKSWLLGTTNSIMIQQRDAAHDCLVNVSPDHDALLSTARSNADSISCDAHVMPRLSTRLLSFQTPRLSGSLR